MRKIVLLILLIGAYPAKGAVHFSLLGSANNNNLGLSNQDSRSASASVAVDVGQYLRLGVTHRQGFIKMEGYRYNELVNKYFYIEEKTHSIANSLDLTIVLYYGEIFVPYIQIGLVKKEYRITSFLDDEEGSVTNFVSMRPVPNGGIGIGVRLDQNFSLKFSYTVSPGVRQLHPNLEPETGVLDTYTSVGISYQL